MPDVEDLVHAEQIFGFREGRTTWEQTVIENLTTQRNAKNIQGEKFRHATHGEVQSVTTDTLAT